MRTSAPILLFITTNPPLGGGAYKVVTAPKYLTDHSRHPLQPP